MKQSSMSLSGVSSELIFGMITYAIVLILLRFATKYPNITLKHYYLLLNEMQHGDHAIAACKTLLMPTPALVKSFQEKNCCLIDFKLI